MSDEEEKGEDIKVILVGEPGTGKTSLINVSVGEKFQEITSSTLLSTFVSKEYIIKGKKYILNIWDTAGQEKYRAMTKIFIKDSKIVIFVYSIDNKESFEGLKSHWLNVIKDSLGDEPIYGLVGNKYDLFMKEEVKEDEAKEYAFQNDMKFQLVSAKEEPETFINFLSSLLEEFLEKDDITPKRKTIFINKEDNNNFNSNHKKNCCKK